MRIDALRRYPEIFKFHERQEREGRHYCRWAPLYGIVVAACIVLGAGSVREAARLTPELEWVVWLAAAALGLVTGLGVYSRGLAKILEAQRTMILIDTEANTRATAEAIAGAAVFRMGAAIQGAAFGAKPPGEKGEPQ